MVKQKVIRIPHPEFGYVEFHGMTPRQQEILGAAEEALRMMKPVADAKKLKNGKRLR